MSLVAALKDAGLPRGPMRPVPRLLVDADGWRAATLGVAARAATLLDLWGEAGMVHMALVDESDGDLAVLSLACPDGRFPSVGLTHPPAQRLERAIADLWGLVPDGAPDHRRWLDHGRWTERRPLSGQPAAHDGGGDPYAFLPAEGPPLHQIPVGPVHAGIIEPGHFRFHANGEIVVRLEERLGYVHRGIEARLPGLSPADAGRIAGRVSGDSTVAYALAFARATEAALGATVPERAVWLRALMAELERLANHLGDIGAICNDAAFALMLAHCGVLREKVLRASRSAFGHRLMMDRIVPGGVAVDLADPTPVRALLADIRAAFPRLVNLYANTASLQNRTSGTGRLSAELCQRFAPGGPVGRASGRAFDARRAVPYPPYDRLAFDTPRLTAGDVDARILIRIAEVDQAMAIIDQCLDALPAGPIASPLPVPTEPAEGLALVEGFRGDIFAVVRIGSDGRVAAARLRDPSWFQWPLLEAVIEGNIVADFPLCNKSFNCSYAGHDL